MGGVTAPQTIDITDSAGPAVVLASASRARLELLLCAGVATRVEPARVDEEEVRASLRAERAGAEDAAETLAELKARKVSRHASGALVKIGRASCRVRV